MTGDTETPLSDADASDRYFDPPYDEYLEWVFGSETQDELTAQLHTSAKEAGRIAERASIGTLVLTHFNPLRSPLDIEREAAETFSGTVIVAEVG